MPKKQNPFLLEDFADATLGFAVSFGVEYAILRYVLDAGRFAPLLAYTLASLYIGVRSIKRRVS